jgi:hypothetical protein
MNNTSQPRTRHTPIQLLAIVAALLPFLTGFTFNPLPPADSPGDDTGPEPMAPSGEQAPAFATGFEDTQLLNPHRLNLGIANWLEFGGSGGAEVWTENGLAHSGGRSVGMELYDINQSRRSELNIFPEDLVGNEFTVSAWYYLPADWSLNVPGIDWNWCALMVLYSEYVPGFDNYVELHIGQPDINQERFNLSLFRRHTGFGAEAIATVEDFPLPRGRWFQVQYYLKRHPTDGAIKVWVDGNLVFDLSGIMTQDRGTYKITVAKIYHDPRDTVPHQLWVDDLAIYRGLVEPY